MNNKTKIYWSLHDYCQSRCSYCPQTFWGGDSPKEISMYIDFTKRAINHYNNLGRSIEWFFSGGEPLDFHDFPELLKLCKENGGSVDLTTNGGKMWMDWWAIEPHVDNLNLTYHYWQKPNLIKFILETFFAKNKKVNISVPIRPDFFKDDMARIQEIEKDFDIHVHRQVLYNNADSRLGMYEYNPRQLRIINGEEIFNYNDYDQKIKDDEEEQRKILEKFANSKLKSYNPFNKYFEDGETQQRSNYDEYDNTEEVYEQGENANAESSRHQDYESENTKEAVPVYTGLICNAGIDVLYINQNGWAKGSECNDRPLSNIWTPKFQFPSSGHKCGMTVCKYPNDWQIIKFT